VFHNSGGVAAADGHAIERVRLARPVPLREGFAAIEAHLRRRGRPPAALCACELRSPEPFSESGFAAFNRDYVSTLGRWGPYRDGVNPVARTNVCPVRDPPRAPSLSAFSYTVAAPPGDARTFVVSGGGEAQEGRSSYRESIVAYGDTSVHGLRAKVRYVVAEMTRRLAALGVDWTHATAAQAYTVHDIGPMMADEIVAAGAAANGLVWHWCRPPVAGIEFEMDVRGVRVEQVIDA
jgi:hypothetical protein